MAVVHLVVRVLFRNGAWCKYNKRRQALRLPSLVGPPLMIVVLAC
jgi:hypothetical protein